MKFLLLGLTFFISCISSVRAQSHKNEKQSCKSSGGIVGDEMENTKTLYMSRTSANQKIKNKGKKIKFPLRFLFVTDLIESKETYIKRSKNSLEKLNIGFAESNLDFYLDGVETIQSIIKIEDLHVKEYALYNSFSKLNDKPNTISVYVFDYETHLCVTTPTSISCGRTSGFSYILSNKANNVVLSKFDLDDDKILTHEMGHFFGLYHTFEETMFGKDNFVEDCNVAGDCICDTPPDPGTVYEVYVNYSECEMIDFYNENGKRYEPLVDNYMAYYKPCYMKVYTFTKGQIELLNMSAVSGLRRRFGR